MLKITHKELIDMFTGDAESILDELVETGRWHILHRLIFERDDKFYECHYREPVNGEWDSEDLECKEVTGYFSLVKTYAALVQDLVEIESLAVGDCFVASGKTYQVVTTDQWTHLESGGSAMINVYCFDDSMVCSFRRVLLVTKLEKT